MNSLPSCFITAWSAAHERGQLSGPRIALSDPAETKDRPPAPNRAVELLRAAVDPIRTELKARLERYDPNRVGIFLGSSTGGIDQTERAYLEHLTRGRMPETYSLEASHSHHSLTLEIRKSLHIEGLGYVVSTACSSTAKALAAAQRWLALGLIDAAIVGGADSRNALTRMGFRSLNLIDPEGCRPFDRTRRGLELGEGAAILLLEREGPSPGPGIHLRAVGESNDAYDLTAPDPAGGGAELAMRRALKIAGLSPNRIDYINAHGTGTKQNDLAESHALARVFGDEPRFSSTKSATGHLLGTAGALEAVLCIEALLQQSAPLNLAPREQDLTLACQPLLKHSKDALAAVLSNSFAFGGSNASVLIARTPGSTIPFEPLRKPIYLISARHSVEMNPTEPVESSILPARVRSRSSPLTHMVARLYEGLIRSGNEQEIALVLGSAFGEMSTTITLLSQLAREDRLSPLRFPGSVHNAAIGLLTQLTQNRGYATALAAGQDTTAAAFADALVYLGCHGGEALALIADEAGPQALLGGETFPALGVAFHLAAEPNVPEDAWAVVQGIEPAKEPGGPSIPEVFRHHFSSEVGPIERAPAAFGLDLAHRVMNEERLAEPATYQLGPSWSLLLTPVPSSKS